MDQLQTESRNPASTHLDDLSALEIVQLMNAEDARVAPAVATQAAAIARAIDVIADRLRAGGRLIYAGAGTSGRLGVLDATECPPTFSAPAGQVIGIIAGGPTALTRAVEGAEDHPEFAEQDLAALDVGDKDVVVGIATSGRTPYVLGAVAYARRQRAFTIGFACNSDAELTPLVDVAITPVVGPEVLSGSTRLKAGTATKLVLNMLTTGAMVRLGKTFGNLMVDLRATNHKLRMRTKRIVHQVTGLPATEAEALLVRCGGELKTALVAHLAAVGPDEARQRLAAAGGQVRLAAQGSLPALASSPSRAGLCLAIDGGGTQTTALLADATGAILGRGQAGPSNLSAVGSDKALGALETAIAGAFAAARLPQQRVAVACLGLAGAARPAEQAILRDWAQRVQLAQTLELTSDAALLLAAGTPDNWGVALIAGTGSIAVGRTRDGRSARAGGWGYLFGDEGSGYRLVLAALEAIARAADGRGAATGLTQAFLDRLQLQQPQELVSTIYLGPWDRTALAALAPLVFAQAANGDAVATAIVQAAAEQLAGMVVAVVRQLGCEAEEVPLALAGGCLLANEGYQQQVLRVLRSHITVAPLATVPEPAAGALRLTHAMLDAGPVSVRLR
jgi:N-acetylmuramic acid 6-phosphate etherase